MSSFLNLTQLQKDHNVMYGTGKDIGVITEVRPLVTISFWTKLKMLVITYKALYMVTSKTTLLNLNLPIQ